MIDKWRWKVDLLECVLNLNTFVLPLTTIYLALEHYFENFHVEFEYNLVIWGEPTQLQRVDFALHMFILWQKHQVRCGWMPVVNQRKHQVRMINLPDWILNKLQDFNCQNWNYKFLSERSAKLRTNCKHSLTLSHCIDRMILKFEKYNTSDWMYFEMVL